MSYRRSAAAPLDVDTTQRPFDPFPQDLVHFPCHIPGASTRTMRYVESDGGYGGYSIPSDFVGCGCIREQSATCRGCNEPWPCEAALGPLEALCRDCPPTCRTCPGYRSACECYDHAPEGDQETEGTE